MIQADELVQLKARLIVGAKAARLIANSPDPVRYEQQEYEVVMTALDSMERDVSRILAELDVLRGMVFKGVSLFIASSKEGADGHSEPVASGDVGAVPEQEAGGGGEGEPPVAAGADGRVPEGRLPRKRTKRSKPRRDPAGDGVLPVALGSGDGERQVDRSENG